jgi:hypothetical protein
MTPGTDWIDQAQRLIEALRRSDPAAADAPTDEAHSSDCRWCPICQMAAVVRGERPEVTAALADVLTAAATALRTVAAAGDADVPMTQADLPEQESEPPPPVQQIDIA